jgi:hypothetical protein
MHPEVFHEKLHELFGDISDCLDYKSREYSTPVDRLHNFKIAASMLRCSPERALLGFLTKHLVSVVDLVDHIDNGAPVDYEMFHEKVIDSVNYLLLLHILYSERRDLKILEETSRIDFNAAGEYLAKGGGGP